ncbi:MAG: hypothetical protein AB2651_18600 [Candidatus Thiodiazotropha sp.]
MDDGKDESVDINEDRGIGFTSRDMRGRLPAGDPNQMDRSTNERGVGERSLRGEGAYRYPVNYGESIERSKEKSSRKVKGLWLYSGDPKIGLYNDSEKWKAVNVYVDNATENASGLLSIVGEVKKYCRFVNARLSQLAILVHGNIQGLVKIATAKSKIPKSEANNPLYRYMSPYTIDSFEKEIGQLNDYLSKNAQIVFYTCLAGAGCEGSILLSKISAWLPGRTIVGFTTIGESGVGRVSSTTGKRAGVVLETGSQSQGGYDLSKLSLRTPRNPYAKHARGGNIVRPPRLYKDPSNCRAWKATRNEYVNMKLFDILMFNRYLYYLGILVYGADSDQEQYEKKTMQGFDAIENDQEFIKLVKERLPKAYVDTLRVTVIPKALFPKEWRQLNAKQRNLYNEIKATLNPYFARHIEFVWRGQTFDKEAKTYKHDKKRTQSLINAMLLARIGKKIPSSVLSRASCKMIFRKMTVCK